jgi:hypothetical protein
MGVVDKFFSYMREHITEHRERFDPTSEPDDFTFAYMKEQHARRDRDDIFRLFGISFINYLIPLQ